MYPSPCPKGNRAGMSCGVVEPVADVERLAVLDLAGLAGEVPVGGELRDVERDALGQPAAGFGRPEQHVGQRRAAGLPAEVGLDQRGRRSAHGTSTEPPLTSTTAVRGFAASTTSASWSIPPASAHSARSLASVSRRAGSPTMSTTRSAARGDSGRLGHQRRGGVAGGRVVPGGVVELGPPAGLLGERVEQGVDAGRVDLRAARALERASTANAPITAIVPSAAAAAARRWPAGPCPRRRATGQGVVGVEVRAVMMASRTCWQRRASSTA